MQCRKKLEKEKVMKRTYEFVKIRKMTAAVMSAVMIVAGFGATTGKAAEPVVVTTTFTADQGIRNNSIRPGADVMVEYRDTPGDLYAGIYKIGGLDTTKKLESIRIRFTNQMNVEDTLTAYPFGNDWDEGSGIANLTDRITEARTGNPIGTMQIGHGGAKLFAYYEAGVAIDAETFGKHQATLELQLTEEMKENNEGVVSFYLHPAGTGKNGVQLFSKEVGENTYGTGTIVGPDGKDAPKVTRWSVIQDVVKAAGKTTDDLKPLVTIVYGAEKEDVPPVDPLPQYKAAAIEEINGVVQTEDYTDFGKNAVDNIIKDAAAQINRADTDTTDEVDTIKTGALSRLQDLKTAAQLEMEDKTQDAQLSSVSSGNMGNGATIELNSKGRDMIGLFRFPIDPEKKIKKATLHLVTERTKGDCNIKLAKFSSDWDEYNVVQASNYASDAKSSYSYLKEAIDAARDVDVVEYYVNHDGENKAMFDVAGTTTLEKWVNDIDVTSLTEAGQSEVNILVTRKEADQDQLCFFSKEYASYANKDRYAQMKGVVEAAGKTEDYLAPALIVEYEGEEADGAAEANRWKETYADILAKTADTVTVADETTVDSALTAYESLSDAAKAIVASEKALLDAMKMKIEELKQQETEPYQLGDVNNNGKIDVGDAVLALQLSMAVDNDFTTQPVLAADVDKDRSVTTSDVLKILKKANGKSVSELE